MKTFTSAAVFGLVPVPPMPATDARSDRDFWPVTSGDMISLQLARLQPDATERMATNDELARMRQELEELSAESRL
jgi:hypothetical protein